MYGAQCRRRNAKETGNSSGYQLLEVLDVLCNLHSANLTAGSDGIFAASDVAGFNFIAAICN
jgi:hypothetical protein